MPGIKYKVKLEMSISDGALEENRYGLWMAVSRRFGSNRLLLLLRNLILLTKLFFHFFLRAIRCPRGKMDDLKLSFCSMLNW